MRRPDPSNASWHARKAALTLLRRRRGAPTIKARASDQADGGGPLSAEAFNEMVFVQDLSEVYLLLDFISGRPDKRLSSIDLPADNQARDGRIMAAEAVRRVSDIRYPPKSNAKERADDAAFLILLNDALNSLAFPARGLSIAYTVLFTERSSADAKFFGRRHAAETAFPGLVTSARRFRLFKCALAWAGLLVTLAAALLLWQVTYGAQLAAKFEDAKRNDTEATAKVYLEIDRQPNKTKDSDWSIEQTCRIKNVDTASADIRVSALRLICDDYAYKHAQF